MRPVGLYPEDGDATVACGSCTACCRKELVILTAQDDARDYPEAIAIDVPNPFTGAPISVAIPHKPDGSCIYLGDKGCSIYEKRPKMCRVFTCVGFVARVKESVSRAQWRRDLKDGALDREIWNAGIKRS